MRRPNLFDAGAVLGPVKAWPGNGGVSVEGSAAASLDRPCAPRPRALAGRDEGKAIGRTREKCKGHSEEILM
jgi:hypothetical protein